MVDKKIVKAARDFRKKLVEDLKEIGLYDLPLDSALERVAAAAPGPDRAAAAASFGGLIRKIRGKIRVEITIEIMALLQITSTVHVARAVMKKVFEQSVSGDLLVERFADPSRNASDKVMPDARKKLETAEGELAAKLFFEVYKWFYEIALPERVDYIKRKRAKS